MHNFDLNKNLIKLLFLSLFIFIWLSLDTNFENIINFLEIKNFTTTIIFFRSIFPFIFFSIIIFFIIIKKQKISILTKNKNINILLYLFYFYFLFQFINHLIVKNELITTYYFFVSIFLLIFFSYVINEKLIQISFFISTFFLILLFCIFGSLTIKYYLTSDDLNLYGTFPHVYESLFAVSTNVIRSSGLARTSFILYIPLFLFLLINPITKKKFLLLFLISFMIFLSQSRLIMIYWLIFVFFSTFYFLRKKKIKIIIKKLLILAVLPFLITGVVVVIKEQVVKKNFTAEIVIFLDNKFNTKIEKKFKIGEKTINNNETSHVGPKIRIVDPLTFSSGRMKYWKQILEKNNRVWMGNGFLGDRFLIKNNASNIIFYTYASGGIISIFIIIFILLRTFYTSLNLIFIKKINLNNNIILASSIFYLGLIVFRGTGENSFSIFSIDLIIFLQSLFICEIEKSKIEKLKKNE